MHDIKKVILIFNLSMTLNQDLVNTKIETVI